MNSRSQIKSYHIFYHPKNKRALVWARKLTSFVKNNYKNLKADSKKPDVVFVLGGDGTILEAI